MRDIVHKYELPSCGSFYPTLVSDGNLSQNQLHECVGSAVGAMGPESFLALLPLKLDIEDLSKSNLWLFRILKQNIIGAHLSFFTNSIMSMVGAMKQRSARFECEGKIYSARSIDGIVYSLWSLLPSFRNYPVDTAQSFKDLNEILCKAIREEPEVRGIICSSLQILIQQNKNILEGKVDFSDAKISVPKERAIGCYNQQVAGDNLNALGLCAGELLSITIGGLASIADKEVISQCFNTVMRKLKKKVTQEAGKAQKARSSNSMHIEDSSSKMLIRAQLFDLAVSLLPGLDAKELGQLFDEIKPALKDEEGLIQKKSYRVFSCILERSDEFISRRFVELLSLMIEALPACHFSAKRHRLECLYFLIVHVTKGESEQRWHEHITSFMTEILLALKEANKKTRQQAYGILVQIGHACGYEEKGGSKENLQQFFNMIAGGLAGKTPHMISATVKGLTCLAYEFTDLVSAVCSLLPSVFLLLKRGDKEINKANLGLLKVLITKSPVQGLQAHLRSMVEALLGWQDNTKNHFKAKVKVLIDMLIKKCGLNAVKEVMPEEHMKLLTNIRKFKQRRERKLASNSEDSRSHMSKATTKRLSRWNNQNIFSEFDNGESESSEAEYMTMKTIAGHKSKASLVSDSKASELWSKKTWKAAKSLQDDLFDQLADEPLDLLDQKKTRSALTASGNLKRKPGSEDEAEIDSEGRLIIHEGTRIHPPTDYSNVWSEAGSCFSETSRRTQKRRKTFDSGWAYTGTEYASKKAGGDVRKKDKLEPYAYCPLDRKMMSRRPEHQAVARKGMSSIVRLTNKVEGKSSVSMKGVKSEKRKPKA
ncbi:putative pentatricopeptide repeat-containing protein, mitochondrial-like [Capsicum annuum]|nr:putative pentatricopeptide repeat-containing protein, mitochondrial-like [Capsicum annuum]